MGDIQTRINRVRDMFEVQALCGNCWSTVQLVSKRITAAQIVQEIKRGNYNLKIKSRVYRIAPEKLDMHKTTKTTVIGSVRDYFKRNPDALVLCRDIIQDIGDADKRVSSVMNTLVINGELRRVPSSPTVGAFYYGLPNTIPAGDFKQRVLEVLKGHPKGLNVRALLFNIKIHCPPKYKHFLKELLNDGLIKQIPDSKKTIYVLPD